MDKDDKLAEVERLIEEAQRSVDGDFSFRIRTLLQMIKHELALARGKPRGSAPPTTEDHPS